MNSYKLGFGLLVAIAITLAYLYGKPHTPAAPSLSAPTVAHLDTTNTATRFPFSATVPLTQTTLNDTQPVAPKTPTATTDLPAKLEPLLSEIHATLLEISSLQQILYNPYDPYQPADDAMREAYQPRLDDLSNRIETLFVAAKDISTPHTLRAMWEQILNLGLEDPASYQVLNLLSYSVGASRDESLFEEMLSVLAAGMESGLGRSNLAYNILLPPETRYYNGNVTAMTIQSATPRQRRIKDFLDNQFLHETNPEVLSTYLNIYQTMSQDAHGLVSAAQFTQQVENLRDRLDPEQYFMFRLQRQTLTAPNNDVATLLRDINSSAMTPEQRQGMITILSNTVFQELSSNSAAGNPSRVIPEQHRQLLLQHLENGLTQPSLQNVYALSEYGTQRYTMALLKHRQQADDLYYQSIVNSKELAEQVGLILGARMAGTQVIEKLQNNVALRQRLTAQLQQPNVSLEVQAILQDALSVMSEESPQPEPDYISEPMPDSGSPDAQSLGY